jgi:hypothetical protein
MATDDYRRYICRDLPLFERGCASKARFVSKAEARAATHWRSTSPGLRPYRCPWDGDHWHLGHRRRITHG